MKKTVIAAALTFAAAGAFAVLGDVVASFTMGGTGYPYGLTRSGDYLYTTREPGNQFYIFRLNAVTGSVINSYPAPAPNNGGFSGLAYTPGNYLYGTVVGSGYPPWPISISRINAATGSVYSSFATIARLYSYNYAGLAPRAIGDGGAGTDALFLPVEQESRVDVFTYTITGSFADVFVPEHPAWFEDAAYDWRNCYLWGFGEVSYYVYGVNTTGSICASFQGPVSIWNTGPLAYYGQYLWVARTDGLVYKIHCPSVQPTIEPCSLGRLKALYR